MGPVRRAERNHAEEMHVLVQDDELIRRLDELLRVGRRNLACQTVRQTHGSGIIDSNVARVRLVEERLALGFHRGHLRVRVEPHRGAIGVFAGVSEPGPRPHAREVRLAVRGARMACAFAFCCGASRGVEQARQRRRGENQEDCDAHGSLLSRAGRPQQMR
jgi:hypothetical protein